MTCPQGRLGVWPKVFGEVVTRTLVQHVWLEELVEVGQVSVTTLTFLINCFCGQLTIESYHEPGNMRRVFHYQKMLDISTAVPHRHLARPYFT
jgi:hypothetical protein